MRHARHYTLEEATSTLPWVTEVIQRMRAARDQLLDEDARSALGEAAPGNGGGEPGTAVSEAFLELRENAAALREKDVVLRDLDRGLVDFPSLRDDHEVYLCWVESEEDEISYWHDRAAAYAVRQPL